MGGEKDVLWSNLCSVVHAATDAGGGEDLHGEMVDDASETPTGTVVNAFYETPLAEFREELALKKGNALDLTLVSCLVPGAPARHLEIGAVGCVV